MIPSFVLSKLYVKGSLKNTPEGFEFTLKNIIDTTMLTGFGPVVVGEQSYEGAAITMTVDNKTYRGDELSRQNPAPARMGGILLVHVKGQLLAPGAQHISVSTMSAEAGKLKFDINDTLS
jgi:hydroxymethylglutaryl-CoA reductase (NADPH)